MVLLESLNGSWKCHDQIIIAGDRRSAPGRRQGADRV